MQLDQEQTEKLARLWQWREGQLPDRCKDRVTRIDDDGCVCIGDVERDHWFNPGALRPDLTDDTTADGLPRTARAAWNDPTLTAFCGMSGRNWTINTSAVEGVFETEAGAWLAAILAAPEAK